MTIQKQPSPATGYFLIVIGIVGIASRFLTSPGAPWTIVAIIKMAFSVSVLVLGIVTVLRKNKCRYEKNIPDLPFLKKVYFQVSTDFPLLYSNPFGYI